MPFKIDDLNSEYPLHALPTGKFNFLKRDRNDPDALDQLVVPDLTEEQVREQYRAPGWVWKFSDAEIDERIRLAREKLAKKLAAK